MSPQERYLSLLKKCLSRSLFDESFDRIPPNKKTAFRRLRSAGYQAVNSILASANLALVHNGRCAGETMLSPERLDNVEFCVKEVIEKNVPGDLIETGVWRGGATILMKAVVEVYEADRTVWVADSFQGLPKPDPKYPADYNDEFWKLSLGIPVETVKRNFQRYGLLDDRVRFIEGFFSDTLPIAPIDRLAVLRLDGDMYESTIVALQCLYPKVSKGGYVIVDDYGMISACKQATEDYRSQHGIADPIQEIDSTGVFWQVS